MANERTRLIMSPLCLPEPIRMLQGPKPTNYQGNFAAGPGRKRGGDDKAVGVAKCSAQTNGRRAPEPAASRANRRGLCEPMGRVGGVCFDLLRLEANRKGGSKEVGGTSIHGFNSKARPRSWWADFRASWTNQLRGAGRWWWRRRQRQQWVRLRVAHGVGAEPRPGAGAAASENWSPE